MLALLHLWLMSYGPAGVVLLLGLAIGYPTGRRFLHGSTAPVFALLLGMAILSLVVCLLSWAGVFSAWSVGAVGVVATGATAQCLRSDLGKWWRRRHLPAAGTIIGFAVLLGALSLFSVLALYPSTAFDATSYHLPLAREIVETHGLTYDPFVRFSFFPQANESVFAVVLLLSRNPICSASLEFSVLAAGTILIPLWFIDARRNLAAGLIGAIVLLSSPVLIWDGTAAMIDAWTMVFVLGGLLLGLDAGRDTTRRKPLLVLMGIFIGVAAASKYSALIYGSAAVVGVIIVIGARREVWRAMLGALGGVLLFAGPWYAWTTYTTGDPLYPFATRLFGNRPGLWNVAEISLQSVAQRVTTQPGIAAILHLDLRFLAGKVLYNTGLGRSPLSWLLGLALLGLLVPRQWRNRPYFGVLVASALSVAAFVNTSADPRFFVPALGTLAVAVGLAVEQPMRILGRIVTRLGRARLPVIAVTCAAAALGGLWTSIGYARMVYGQGSPPTSGQSVAAYLAPRVQCYAEVAYLNRIDGSRYRAWGYACEQAHYYAQGLLIGDAFSVGAWDRIFNDGGASLPSPYVLAERLGPLHVKWIIVPSGRVVRPKVLEAGGLFKFVMEDDGDELYKVLPSGASTGT